jgi:hypothetical protein
MSAENAIAQSTSIERVAVLDPAADKVFTANIPGGKMPIQNGIVHDPKTSFELALAEDEMAKLKLSEGLEAMPPPKTIEAGIIAELSRPPSVPSTEEPDIPQITGAGAPLNELAPQLNGTSAKSIVGAVAETIRKSGKSDPDSGVHYGMGDSDYIEDMMVRTQLVDDNDTGERFVEVKFGLLESKVDALADQLVLPAGAMKGGWSKTQVSPGDLVTGDKIAVRVGYTGSLKPHGESRVPTATVGGSPTLIGKSQTGFDVYRVPVAFANGDVGEVDMEARPTPSIPLFVFDPELVVPPATSSYGTVPQALSVTAQNAGWKVEDGYGYQRAKVDAVTGDSPSSYGIFVDKTGVKQVSQGQYLDMRSGGGSGQLLLRRDLGDGAQVHIALVGTATSGRKTTASTSHSDERRMTLNGQVTIRVPIEKDTAPDKADEIVSLEVSKALEAVGIPPEAQGPPTPEQIAKLAMNKVHKQFTPTSQHMAQSNATGMPDDAGTQAVLAEIDSLVGTRLGRKATVDDIHLQTWPNGRVTVVMSDEVAHAVGDTRTATHFAHRLGGQKLQLLEILSGPVGGLLSSDERFSAGVMTHGASPQQDNWNDAANRVYLYPQTGSQTSNSNAIFFSAPALGKMVDQYTNNGDSYGWRPPDNRVGFGSLGSQHHVKTRIDRDQIGVVVTQDATWLIAELKKRGIETIGERPLEEVILNHGFTIPKDWEAGIHAGDTEIPLSTFLAGVTSCRCSWRKANVSSLKLLSPSSSLARR